MIDNCFVEKEPLLSRMLGKIRTLTSSSDEFNLSVFNFGQMVEVYNHRWYETERAVTDPTHPWHNYVKFGKTMPIGDVMFDFIQKGYNVGYRFQYRGVNPSPLAVMSVKRPDDMHRILGYYKAEKVDPEVVQNVA